MFICAFTKQQRGEGHAFLTVPFPAARASPPLPTRRMWQRNVRAANPNLASAASMFGFPRSRADAPWVRSGCES